MIYQQATEKVQAGFRRGFPVIKLTRLNDKQFWLNYRHIELVESHPDTVVTLTNDHKYIVKESPEQITEQILAYHKKIFSVNLPEAVDI